MRLLLLDTCGETASLAVAENGSVLRERTLAPRSASGHLVGAIREELASLGWPLQSLNAVGVVNGPGSFTGVRVGLAAAKGLCDVAGLRLVTLSRLEVLLHAGGAAVEDFAVLDAGRQEFYVRSGAGTEEWLLPAGELQERAATQGRVLVAEDKLLVSLEALSPVWVELPAARALALAEKRLLDVESSASSEDPEDPEDSVDSVERADASYVRQARSLYAAGQTAPKVSGAR